MKKRIYNPAAVILIVVLVCFCSTFAACTSFSDFDSAEEKSSQSAFICVEDAAMYKIVYHRETKVMYVVSDGFDNRGTFTLLVNEDGSPMIYEETE